MKVGETLVAENREEHAAFAAELLGRAIAEAIEARGVARVALSGGTTPSDAYRKLASFALRFDRVEWFWVDERAVPPANARSNFGAAVQDLGLSVKEAERPGPKGRFFRMRGEAKDLKAAAAEYEAELRRTFGIASAVAFDAVVMGVGDDGHTASLFPGMKTAEDEGKLVLAVPAQPEKGLEARLTLTTPVLRESHLTLVLVRGAKKKDVVVAARSAGSLDEVPSRLLQQTKGRLVWVLDQEAV